MKHFNKEIYDSTIKFLINAKKEIANSDNPRMSIHSESDYQPYDEEVEAWMDSLSLPYPSDDCYDIVYELPEVYWSTIFGYTEQEFASATNQELELVKNTDEYKNLFDLYASTYKDMYQVVREESAYHQFEFDEEQRYYDSMRGCI